MCFESGSSCTRVIVDLVRQNHKICFFCVWELSICLLILRSTDRTLQCSFKAELSNRRFHQSGRKSFSMEWDKVVLCADKKGAK